MKHIHFILTTVLLAFSFSAGAQPPGNNNRQPRPGSRAAQQRTLKICVAADAPAVVQAQAKRILDAAASNPLLQVMAGSQGAPESLSESNALLAGDRDARALHHLIVVGAPTDPLVKAVWQHEARFNPPDEVYVFGFGTFRGDMGFIESERNPFLYNKEIQSAPYTAMVVTITGTTPEGLASAVDAFLEKSVINGVIAQPGWQRPEMSLLDRAPLQPDDKTPDFLPETIDGWQRIGFTQCPESDYRGVEDSVNLTPLEMWRVKYYRPGVWDDGGINNELVNYLASTHRAAYGNTVLAMRFANTTEAKQAVNRLARAARLRPQGDLFAGNQPGVGTRAYSVQGYNGRYAAFAKGDWVFMSSLPAATGNQLSKMTRP